jgi:hypothetical protein
MGSEMGEFVATNIPQRSSFGQDSPLFDEGDTARNSVSFDITDLYKGWADGSISNDGVAFIIDGPSFCVNGDEFFLYTSDYSTDQTLRPKLIVQYADPEPVPTMTEWGMIIFMFLAGLGSVYYLRRRRRA